MARSSSRRFKSLALGLSLAVGSTALDCSGLVQGGHGWAFAQTQRQQGSMQLRLKRRADALDVVIEGIGAKPELQQRLNGLIWEAKLNTKGQPGLLRGPQTLSLPELGIESVSLNGGGDSYRIVISAIQGQSLSDPVVSADGRNLILTFAGLGTPQLQTARVDLTTPGRVPQARYAPPLRPRAVAPPLGDMAVGTMVLQNTSYVNVSGPPVTLTLNQAPAKDALLSIARLGGYGFVFVDDSGSGSSSSGGDGMERPVTMTFANETYSRTLNSLLLASGLQAKLDGRTLLVGPNVRSKSFGPQVSKVFRLNQVDASGASQYLGNLGASIQVTNTSTTTSSESSSAGTSSASTSSTSATTSTFTNSQVYGADQGPLLGLVGTTDARLNTITLVGDSRLISVAEGYLKQIDLRKRQVAVKVQILNVDLTNDKSIDSSFSARLGNTFIVNESGKAFMNFGDYRPGNSDGTGLLADGTTYATPGSYGAGIPQVPGQRVFDPPFIEAQEFVNVTTFDSSGNQIITQELRPRLDSTGQPIYEPSRDPAAAPQLVERVDSTGQPIYVPGKDPNRFEYPKNSFYGYLEAAIVSSSAKTLAQPTLLVQEGETASVETGTSVITSVSTTDTPNGSTQFTYSRANAGLNLEVSVDKIDDNGFVTMDLSPEVSVPQPAGTNQGVAIFNISGRKLSSGKIRLRDRQTLVLTGVIQDQDKEQVTKWPILGDLPFIGQLFRKTANSRQKNELVILVTPSIIDDEQGGTYGYGYRPSTREARQLMGPR